MTPIEFKAWFQGFTENIKGVPSAKQWERIKERVDEVHGDAVVTERIVERRPWWPTWYGYAYNGSSASPQITTGITWTADYWRDGDLSNAAYCVGKAEAEQVRLS